MGLYYVYDNVGETVIAGPIPAANDLVAAIGFRDSFIKNKDKRIPYSYKSLDLVRFATFDVDEDGCMTVSEKNIVRRIIGGEIMDFIRDESLKLGIDDEFVEEEKEGE